MPFRRSVPAWLALAVAACDDGAPTSPIDTGPTGTPGDDDDTPIEPLRDDDGSVVIVSNRPSIVDPAGGTLFTGMFVESNLGWINLAECLGVPGAFCADGYPTALDTSVLVQAQDPTLRDDLVSRQVGEQLALGALEAPLLRDGELQYYYAGFPATQVPPDPMGLALSGAWGPYQGDADVTPPTPMVVTSHPTDRDLEFYDSDPVRLTWQPGARGDVMLLVDTPRERRLWWLEDDGAFELDLGAAGVADGERVLLDLGRWGRGTVDHDGHRVDLQVKSNQRLRGTFRTIGAREPLDDLPDTCAEAEGYPALDPGNYSGNNAQYVNNVDPTAGQCTDFVARGQDAILPLDLFAGDVVQVTYTIATGDASVYLMEDCRDTRTCVAGADTTEQRQPESLVYVAPDDARVYLVLDAFQRAESDFTLDLEITSVAEDVLAPYCADAITAGPIGPGTYQGHLGGNANLLAPDCALGQTDGGEGMAEVYLMPDETLTARLSTPGAASTLYLLYNCALGDSCAAAAVGGQLQYQNVSGASEHLYLVVDGGPSVDQYVLDVDIQ